MHAQEELRAVGVGKGLDLRECKRHRECAGCKRMVTTASCGVRDLALDETHVW